MADTILVPLELPDPEPLDPERAHLSASITELNRHAPPSFDEVHPVVERFETDPDRLAHDEYRTQLSVYYHVLASVYPDRSIQATVFYTQTATSVTVDPVSIDELDRLSRGRHH